MRAEPPAPTIFISYSHTAKGEAWKERLVEHLSVSAAEQRFAVSDDRRISAGQDWTAEIEQALDEACVAVLLISSAYLTSRFLRDEELPRLSRRHGRGELTLVPILARARA